MHHAGYRSRWLVALGVVGALSACADFGETFDSRKLRARHAVLSSHEDHGLADAAPYFAPTEDGVVLVLCRWTTDYAIPVVLPPSATAVERTLLARALDAWAAAGLGVSFDVVASRASLGPAAGSRRIEIEFPGQRDEPGPQPAADAIADCAVPEVATGADPIAAEITYASIHLRRSRRDNLGRNVALTRTELLGAVVHELGHALGYPGHVRHADAVMGSHGQMDAVRRWGRWLEEGRALNSAPLAALYALPSGTRVGFLPLSSEQLQPIQDLQRAARAHGLVGPFTRVGDEGARLLWRTSDHRSATLTLRHWKRAIRSPRTFALHPNTRARLLVSQ